jgi:hypothetical protein
MQETRTLEEALVICNGYHLPIPSERVIALKPYLDCLQDASDRHPIQVMNRFVTFQKELQLKYDNLHDDEWTPRRGMEIENSIHAVLRALWRGLPKPNRATESEREGVLREFPMTAEALQAKDWVVTKKVVVDPQLELLRASFDGFKNAGTMDEELRRTPSEAFCKRLIHFGQEVDYLTELWKDVLDIGPDRATLKSELGERYHARIEVAEVERDWLRAETDRAVLQPAHCFPGTS